MNSLNGVDPDNTAFVGLAAVARIVSPALITHIVGRLAREARPINARDQIRAYFRRPTRPDDVQVFLATDLIAGVDQQMQIYKTLLIAIGSLSIAISGVGIMNVMLMSVAERQAEIGLRAALGASANAIRAMFLFEALGLSITGSALGALVGVSLAWVFAEHSGWRFEFSFDVFPLGLGLALAVGLFFGFYPAHRAASIDPIQALRTRM